jgi:nucleoside-diphosphate-sugar epimerase
MMRKYSITGATGFLGRHLVESLARRPDVSLRALVHRTPDNKLPHKENLRWVRGDLGDPNIAADLLTRGSTLIHLAYPDSWSPQTHLANITQLARAAAEKGVRRVVHCSTAAVAGAASDEQVNETTPPVPHTEYERSKLALESAWREHAAGRFDLVIARPTAVFGPGGKNLLKLADALAGGYPVVNYLRSSLFGSRRMNLVYISNVIAAIEFLATREKAFDGAAFLISEDDDPLNNFRDVERILKREFGVTDYPLSPLPVPSVLLSLLLRQAGRSNANPRRVYDSTRLREEGWSKTCGLEQGLQEFAAWYLSAHLSDQLPTRRRPT